MTLATIDLLAMNDLIRQMAGAAGALSSSAQQLKSTSTGVLGTAAQVPTLNQAAGWVNDQLPGLRRRLALAQQIENQAINFGLRHQGKRATVQIDESLLSILPPGQARALGADAAKQLNEAKGQLSPELIAILAKNQSDPYFAAGFARDVSLPQLSWALRLASRERERIIQESPSKAADLDKWKVSYTSLVTALGTTLGTATRNQGDLALPPGFAEKYANAITEGETSSSTPSKVAYGQGAALSLVLRYGRFSTAFLDTVSKKVYDYEYARKDAPVWEPRSYWEPYHSFAGAYQPDGKAMPDALANILEALSHNPEAAQNFFDVANPHAATATVEINRQQVTVNNRLKYLLQDRTWPADDGDGLGNALQTATTTWRDRTAQGKTSATIAGQTFALIGQQVGHGKDGGHFIGLDERQGWKPGESMRDSLAQMLSSYAPDLVYVLGSSEPARTSFSEGWVRASYSANPPDTAFPPNGPLGAMVDPTLLGNLFGVIGEDDKAVAVVSVGMLAAGQLLYGYAFAEGLRKDPADAVKLLAGRERSPNADGAGSRVAYAMSELMKAAFAGGKDNEAFEKRRAEAVSKALGLALRMPIIPTPKGPWTGLVLDIAKSAALDAIAKGPEPNSGEIRKLSDVAQAQLRDLTMTSLLTAGYLKPEVFAAANTPTAPDKFRPPPRGAFRTGLDGKPTQPLEFDFKSRAYIEWVDSGQAPTGWIDQAVIDRYRARFPALRE